MTTFCNMKLPEALTHTLRHMGFKEPTPIQAKAIPEILQGKDILGSAQTGTGKTGAFGIPLVSRLLSNPKGLALVMTPTRELATQVMSQLHLMLGKKSKIKTSLLIGGDSMGKQLSQLRQRPRLIVGTPGRINDHLKRKSLNLSEADFLVLDETDRMLDMGFTIQIETIMKHMAEKRQTLLFSATVSKSIARIAEKYLSDPVRIAVGQVSAPAADVQQDLVRLKESEKYPTLLSHLQDREGSIIVFVKTKFGTERMATKLSKEGHSVDAIHGDLKQNKRDRVISGFRNKKYRILVATDVAARGLDIPHIEHVINYDLPQCAEDYIHRIGRTARAGRKGAAVNLVTPGDKRKWHAIARLLNPDMVDKEEKFDSSAPRPKKRRFKPSSERSRPFSSKGASKGIRSESKAKKPEFKKKKHRKGPSSSDRPRA